jgi:nucleoside-diphosphate-sugar epimerase
MKILITGGNGYIARNLRRMFENVGHNVIAPSRLELDMTNISLVKKYFITHTPDGVIHTAIKGGHRGYEDTPKDFSDNVVMFENLMEVVEFETPIVIYGSGAEFDRRRDIDEVEEEEIFKAWPIDLYGLAKNIIARRIMSGPFRYRSIYLLNIFNCFNYDEECTRFIRKSITNIKCGLPIEVHQNKKMDFFYFDDLFTLTENFLLNPTQNVKVQNAVYMEKLTLLDIGHIIANNMSHMTPKICINSNEISNSYTGNGVRINNSGLNLIGLDEGIIRTIKKLT